MQKMAIGINSSEAKIIIICCIFYCTTLSHIIMTSRDIVSYSEVGQTRRHRKTKLAAESFPVGGEINAIDQENEE